MTFSEWAYEMVQVRGYSLTAYKGEDGANLFWECNETRDRFYL